MIVSCECGYEFDELSGPRSCCPACGRWEGTNKRRAVSGREQHFHQRDCTCAVCAANTAPPTFSYFEQAQEDRDAEAKLADQLAAALRRYGLHECVMTDSNDTARVKPCTCGLDAILDAYSRRRRD